MEHENLDDPTTLWIKGTIPDRIETKSYIRKTANAILATHQNHGIVHMRCVGPPSLNNAIKSIIVATGDATTKGVELVMTACFKTVYFGDDKENPKTAIVLKIFERE